MKCEAGTTAVQDTIHMALRLFHQACAELHTALKCVREPWQLCIKRHSQSQLFPQRFILPENHGYVPTLSPPQVTSLLSVHEGSLESSQPGAYSVRAFDSNQLASNHPIEDRRAVCHLHQTEGSLYAVYDGHAGAACAQAVSERLFHYIATSLLSQEQLEAFSHAVKIDAPMEILHRHQFNNDYNNEDMLAMYQQSLIRFVVETLSMGALGICLLGRVYGS